MKDWAPAPTRKLAENLIVLGAGEIAAKLVTILAFTYLGRALGPESYGRFEFAFAVLVFFNIPVDLGLGTYGAREIARDHARAATLASAISMLRLALAAASYLLLIIFAFTVVPDSQTRLLLLLVGISLFPAPALLQWVFQGLDRMHWVAWASVVRQGVFAAAAILLVRSPESLVWAAVAECGAAFSVAAFWLITARRSPEWPSSFQIPSWPSLMLHLRAAAPIGVAEMAWAFLWYVPTVTLGLITADESLGWFGASHRCLTSLHSFVYLYFFNLLPSLSRAAADPGPSLNRLLDRSLAFTIWSGLFVALVGILLSRQILTALYGARFAGGERILSLLIWVIPVTLISGHFRYGLVAYGLERLLLVATVIAAIGSVIGSAALAPLSGALGVAIALLLANSLHLAFSYVYFRRAAAVRVLAPALRPAMAMAAALGISWLAGPKGLWISAGSAIALYCTGAIISERRDLLRLLSGYREAVAQ